MFADAKKRQLRAAVTLIGTVVGVGVFGLPYVFSRAGFAIGFAELIVLGVVMLLLFLMYAEITVQTPGKQRFAGYMERYLGQPGRVIAFLVTLLSMLGALVAFTILGADFFSRLSGIPETMAALIIMLVVSLVTFGGIATVSRVAVWTVSLILVLYAILIVVTLPAFQLVNIQPISTSPADWFVPYGVIIFSLAGLGAIPEMHDILERKFRELPRVVLGAYAVIVVLYGLFTLAVVGATGAATSPDAIAGLSTIIHPALSTLGAVLGLISVLSIQSLMSIELIASLQFDLKVPAGGPWLFVTIAPFLFYLFGMREFISVIGFVGSILSGSIGVLVVLAYERMKKTVGKTHKCFRLPSVISYIVLAAFVFGMITEIVYTRL
ncbi:MAG: aromatic amino acid transport family protein [Patescibacteria group bacterium]